MRQLSIPRRFYERDDLSQSRLRYVTQYARDDTQGGEEPKVIEYLKNPQAARGLIELIKAMDNFGSRIVARETIISILLKYEKMDLVAALAALAQDNRLDVFRLLVQAGPEGMSAGRGVTALDPFAPTIP